MKLPNPPSALRSFLFTTWEGGGNVGPAIIAATRLLKRGHRVRFQCDEASRGDAEAAGLEFRPWAKAPNRPSRSPSTCPVRDWEATSPQEGIQRLMDKLIYGRSLDYARDVIDELEREPADLVITSEMLPGVMAACESRGQCFAVLAANLCFYPIPEMPTFGPGLPPPRSPEEEALHAQIKEGSIAMFDLGLDALNQTRQALGLSPLKHAVDQIHATRSYLLATSRAFDFPVPRLPEAIRYVGPLLDEPSDEAAWASPWPESDQRPLVLVGFSTTYQNHASVLQNVMDALAGLPVRVLVTLGQVAAHEVKAAANAVVVSNVPHNTVMRNAALIITHGGHGTVTRALKHRRPLLILPHGRDQDENAIRVTERGAGLSLSASSSVAKIREAAIRLLENPEFPRAAARLGEAIDHEAGDHSLEEVLEEMAATRGTSCPCAC